MTDVSRFFYTYWNTRDGTQFWFDNSCDYSAGFSLSGYAVRGLVWDLNQSAWNNLGAYNTAYEVYEDMKHRSGWNDYYGDYVIYVTGLLLEEVVLNGTVTITGYIGAERAGYPVRFVLYRVETDDSLTEIATSTSSNAPSVNSWPTDLVWAEFDISLSSITFGQGTRIAIKPQAAGGEVGVTTTDVAFCTAKSTALDYGMVVFPQGFYTANMSAVDTTGYWNTTTYVTKDTTHHWDTLESIEVDTTVDYHTYGIADTSPVLEWDTESILTELAIDTTHHWDVVELIEKDTTIAYNTMVGVMQSMVELEIYAEPHTLLDMEGQTWTALELEEVA